jgi:hypothetical protein
MSLEAIYSFCDRTIKKHPFRHGANTAPGGCVDIGLWYKIKNDKNVWEINHFSLKEFRKNFRIKILYGKKKFKISCLRICKEKFIRQVQLKTWRKLKGGVINFHQKKGVKIA